MGAEGWSAWCRRGAKWELWGWDFGANGAWLAITGQSHPGTLRGTAVAGIALLLPLGALVYGFWQRIPSRWVPVGCVAAAALLAVGLVVTR